MIEECSVGQVFCGLHLSIVQVLRQGPWSNSGSVWYDFWKSGQHLTLSTVLWSNSPVLIVVTAHTGLAHNKHKIGETTTHWQVKKTQFRHSPFSKKKSNLTIDLLSLGIYTPAPQVLTYGPQILRGVRIWTPFRVPGPERRVKRFRCFGLGRRWLSVLGC